MEYPNLLYIGNKLSSAGRTVTSIETLGELLKSEGFTVYMASSKKNKILRLLDMMWAVVQHRKKVSYVLIDTYSTQNFYYAVAVANVCRLFQLPYVPILRGGDLPKRLVSSRSQSWKLFRGALSNVAPSEYLMQKFQSEGFNNLRHIPNSIELSNYQFKRRENVSAKLLWVRSFADIYNPELALDIVDRLIKEGIDAKLCMVGPDKDGSLKRCKGLAAKRDLPITFTGKLEKKEWIDLAKDYDVFINTTNFDNTPVSVLEAMALGLPVVTTNVGGIPYLLTHSENAILVNPNEAEPFCNAIKDFLNHPNKAEQLAHKARLMVENYDWEIVKHSWIELLKA